MPVKNICICKVESPFVRGGAEIQLESLAHHLRKHGYQVANITIPFIWYPIREILKNCVIWRWIDLEKMNKGGIDLVICSKFPSYAVKHPNKVTWLIHQMRQAYELHETEYSLFTSAKDDEAVRQAIVEFDTRMLAESKMIFTESQRVADRLRQYNGLTGKALYHPPQHWDDHYHNTYGGYVLSVGRLVPLKRVDLLLKALAEPNVWAKAIIVGDGPEREKLTKLAEELDLGSRVKFVGSSWGKRARRALCQRIRCILCTL